MQGKNGEAPCGDAGQLILLGLFLLVWVGDSFFLGKSTFLSAYLPIGVRFVFLGVTLMLATFLAWSGHAAIAHEHRPDRVITTGAFRYVRHPLYLASLLVYLGLAVSTASLFSLALLIGIWLFHDYLANYEEKLLEVEFGEEYQRYQQRTGKWFPKIGAGR